MAINSSKLQKLVYGYCRNAIMIDEIINCCFDYYRVIDSFDPARCYNGMRLVLDDDSKYFVQMDEGFKAKWSTCFGKIIVKKDEMFFWDFEIIDKNNIHFGRNMVIGVITSGYEGNVEDEGSCSFTFVSGWAHYGCVVCSNPFLEAKGEMIGIKNKGHNFGSYRDTLRLILDLKHYSVSYIFNGKGKAHCIDNIDVCEYRLAVSLNVGRKLKLIDTGLLTVPH